MQVCIMSQKTVIQYYWGKKNAKLEVFLAFCFHCNHIVTKLVTKYHRHHHRMRFLHKLAMQYTPLQSMFNCSTQSTQ